MRLIIGYARHVIHIGFWFHSITSRFLPHPPFVEICTYGRIGKSIRASIGIRTFNNYLQYRTYEESHPVNPERPSSWSGSWCPTTMKQSFWLYEWEAPLYWPAEKPTFCKMQWPPMSSLGLLFWVGLPGSVWCSLFAICFSVRCQERWALLLQYGDKWGPDEKREELSKVLLVLICVVMCRVKP